MATLNKKQVLHIADISNLKLTDEEIDKFTPQLSKIVDFISTLNEVDTTNTEPAYQIVGLTNVFHEDEVDATNIFSQDKALSGTDNTHNGLFKVRAILVNRN
jgi:aspartyl-tRNA(Asn)/glutamyl-tRNA(Gln) amidotransferase subunit C